MKIKDKIILVLGVAVFIAFIALVGGTILYWIWPIAIPATFPGAVASGIIAGKLSWWCSVTLVWIFSILIKMLHYRYR